MGSDRFYGAAAAVWLLVSILGIGMQMDRDVKAQHAAEVRDRAKQELVDRLFDRVDSLNMVLEEVSYWSDKYGISEALAKDILEAADEVGVDRELAFGLVYVESRFYPRATSHVGARGLTQVMPATWRLSDPGASIEDMYDTERNLRMGFRYLRAMLYRYNDTRLALLAYNRGPGRVNQLLRQGVDPSNGYATAVLRMAD